MAVGLERILRLPVVDRSAHYSPSRACRWHIRGHVPRDLHHLHSLLRHFLPLHPRLCVFLLHLAAESGKVLSILVNTSFCLLSVKRYISEL